MTFSPARHSGEGRNPYGSSKYNGGRKFFAAFYILGILWVPAFAEMTIKNAWAEEEKPAAQEQKVDEQKTEEAKAEDTYSRFAPDFCDFEITFPEEPSIAKKCVPGGGCYDVNSYVMVYDLRTTVDFSVTCNPPTPEAYKQYTEGVMKAALAGMVENRNLTDHETRFQQLEKVKNAALTGVGTTGRQEKIYSGQLWIGPNSVFTVQAELVGSEHADADKSFRDILASIKTKDGKQIAQPKKATAPKRDNQ